MAKSLLIIHSAKVITETQFSLSIFHPNENALKQYWLTFACRLWKSELATVAWKPLVMGVRGSMLLTDRSSILSLCLWLIMS